MKFSRLLLCSSMATISIASASQIGFAQEGPILDEIVVVAQKRTENIQDVPITVTALSAEAMEAKGLYDVLSVGGQTPNVTLRSSAQFGGSSSILVSFIRGIGQNDFAFNLEPGVGLYVDGVYLARNIGANVDLLDLERVEVLKGPQGTLFGRNAIGGAINIVSRDPASEFGYKLEATTGSYSRADLRGVVDMPISENLVTSLAFSTKHRKGWQERIEYTGDTGNNPIYLGATNGAFGGPATNGNTDDTFLFPVTDTKTPDDRAGNQNQTALRAKAVWTPTDRLKIKLIGDYLDVDEQGAPFSLLATGQEQYVAIYNTCITGDQGLIAGVAAQIGLQVGAVCNGLRGNAGSVTGIQPALSSEGGQHLPYDDRYVIHDADGNINPDLTYAKGVNYSYVENYGFNGQIEFDLTDNLQVKSITGYRSLESAFGANTAGSPFLLLSPTFSDDEEQFSQEIQFIGDAWDNRWKFVAGAYYFHEYGSHEERVPFASGLIQVTSISDTYDTKSYAAFMHNNIEITDKIGLTLGVRYTEEKKSFTGLQHDENAFGYRLIGLPAAVLADQNDIYRLYPEGLNELKFDDVSFRVGAEYHANDDTMFYASFANGYKGGGWTTRLTAPRFSVSTGGVITPSPAPTFEPENADSYELGIKSTFANGRARLNAAIFQTDYDNIQLTFQEGISPVTANGGNGRIKGVEVEFDAAVSDNITIDASGGYLKTEYISILPNVNLTGDETFVNSPKWTMQAGANYTHELGNGGALIPRLDWVYQSKSYNDELNFDVLATEAHSIFNGSLRYVFPSENVEIFAGVSNIGDKRVLQSGYMNAGAIFAGTFNRPREYFLTLKIRN